MRKTFLDLIRRKGKEQHYLRRFAKAFSRMDDRHRMLLLALSEPHGQRQQDRMTFLCLPSSAND
jgi:hypothetical protein